MRAEVIDAMVTRRIPAKAFSEQWESAELADDVRRVLLLDLPIAAWAAEDGIDEEALHDRITAASDAAMAEKAERFGADLMRFIEKSVLLQTLDAVWKEHLLALDQLRQGIGLRAYGQKDPLNEYKSEAFALFGNMLDDLKERVTTMLSGMQLQADVPPEPALPPMFENHPEAILEGADYGMGFGNGDVTTLPVRPEIAVDLADPATWVNTPRNAPCPCGSGKKYKHCHGKV
jgi:preprotein translocase subunit SecA